MAIGAIGVCSSFSSSSSSSTTSSSSYLRRKPKAIPSLFPLCGEQHIVNKLTISRRNFACLSTVQESSPSTAKEVKTTSKEAPAKKPKPPAKAPAKPLPQLMQEEVIPSLKQILETRGDDLSDIELSFENNRLDGSFLKKGNPNPYLFWAFFPDGVLTGPKGFSLSSNGSVASTVEPFLIDEKRITARHVVFWVEKRLAAQGIISVWNN